MRRFQLRPPRVAVLLVIGLATIGCAFYWDVPTRSGHKLQSARPNNDHTLVVPSVLLEDKDLGDLARNCAVTANRFTDEARGNRFWSRSFGTIQVAGATSGTIATSVAFASDSANSKDAKIGAAAFAVAAGIAALDRAYEPGNRADHQERVALKIGHLILLAALQVATNDRVAAGQALASCQDPTDIDDSKSVEDLASLQRRVNDLIAGSRSDGGTGSDAGGN